MRPVSSFSWKYTSSNSNGAPASSSSTPSPSRVPVAGLGEQGLRLLRVEGARFDGGIVLPASRAEGADCGLRVAEHDLVDDARSVREPGHRLAHSPVREACRLAVSAQVPADVAVARHRVHEFEVVGLGAKRLVVEQPLILPGAGAVGVDVAVAKRGEPCAVVLDDLPQNAVEARRRRSPVAGVAFELDEPEVRSPCLRIRQTVGSGTEQQSLDSLKAVGSSR